MREFTVDESHRWYEWQHANMLSAQRSHRLSIVAGTIMLGAALITVVVAVLLR